jgi:hypothetical protein
MVVPFWDGGVYPTRVILKKRLQGIENKGRQREIGAKEALSHWKQGGNESG